MTVAVVTPWRDHLELWDDYRRVLDDGRPDERLIVDDGSQPPLEFADLRLDEPSGFCRACNAGLEATRADIVVFLNNDVRLVEPGWLDRLLDDVEPGVLAGPRLAWSAHTAVDGVVMPYLDGWCLAGMRDELNELGGFDETLAEPAYYSDNLLCLEARANGMTLRETAPLGLIHKGGATSQPGSNPAVQAATAANRAVYADRVRWLRATVLA